MTPKRGNGPRAGLLLTPGAGADRNQSALVAVDERVSPEGIAVERMDFPYRLAGRKSPDRLPVLIDAVRAGAASLAKDCGLAARQVGSRRPVDGWADLLDGGC